MPARDVGKIVPDKQVDSVCPYCGVGCQLTYNIKDNTILYVQGKDGPANSSRLCVKGRYGFDYVQHPHRLTKPLIRKPGVPKHKDFVVDPENWQRRLPRGHLGGSARLRGQGPARRSATPTASGRSPASAPPRAPTKRRICSRSWCAPASARNNVDHCTRLCHASSVAALMEGINSGAVSNQVRDVANAEVIFVIGANPTVNHPVAATWMKNAAKAGAKLIVADPRRSDLARHATYYLQFNADTDVALLNAMLHVIVEEGLVDEAFIRDRTSGYEALAENVKKFSPERMAPICGIDAQTIREVARLYATSKASIILWGMGISQHVHGTDNARCLIALALSTGQIGKPGSGLHPLRGQNNVQGASDSGSDPDVLSRLSAREHARGAAAVRDAVAAPTLDPDPGLTVVEIMNAAKKHEIRGMYIMGENPAMSDPDVDHAREALAALDHLRRAGHLPHRDGLSRRCRAARHRVAREGRHRHQHRSHGAARAQGDRAARRRAGGLLDSQRARRAASALDWYYDASARRVQRDADVHGLDRRHHLGSARARVVGHLSVRARRAIRATRSCSSRTSRPPSGRGKFVPADLISAAERPDAEYPMVLITGRQLEHWHTGSMTRRASNLDYIEPEPVASLHPLDLEALRRRAGRHRSPSNRGAARSRSTRAPTTARREGRCSCRSATTRRRRTC